MCPFITLKFTININLIKLCRQKFIFNSQAIEQQVGFMNSSQKSHLFVDRQSHVCPPQDSFEILRKYRSRRRKLVAKSSILETHHATSPQMSTQTIIKLAAQKFISFSNPPSSSPPLSQQDSEAIHLVQNLLYSAEKIADNQYERAIKFLKTITSPMGTPVQRLVFYFSHALFEKIANETGRIIPKNHPDVDPLDQIMFPNVPLFSAFQREYPLAQITKFVGVEAILDHLQGAKKVHIIDLHIRSGGHWIVLMQALATRHEHFVEHLKVTAIGTKWTTMIEETGKQLTNFARSLHLNFSFKIVHVDDILQLNPTQFDRINDESVSIYASYTLMGMLNRADRMEHLMRVIKSLNPGVMIVTETEVNCNSPNFVGRFVESLFFFGAFFDSLGECFERDEWSRVNAESTWVESSIRNVVSADGEERTIRHVDMNVWRAFFNRQGLVETHLSPSCIHKAYLRLQTLPRGDSCTLCFNGKGLILGWKGTPFSSISAWNFHSSASP